MYYLIKAHTHTHTHIGQSDTAEDATFCHQSGWHWKLHFFVHLGRCWCLSAQWCWWLWLRLWEPSSLHPKAIITNVNTNTIITTTTTTTIVNSVNEAVLAVTSGRECVLPALVKWLTAPFSSKLVYSHSISHCPLLRSPRWDPCVTTWWFVLFVFNVALDFSRPEWSRSIWLCVQSKRTPFVLLGEVHTWLCRSRIGLLVTKRAKGVLGWGRGANSQTPPILNHIISFRKQLSSYSKWTHSIYVHLIGPLENRCTT